MRLWGSLTGQGHDRRSPAASLRGCVMKGDDMRVAAQQFAHALFLDSPAFSMNDSYRAEPRVHACIDIIRNQGCEILGSERVQIDYVLNWDTDRLHGVQHGFRVPAVKQIYLQLRFGSADESIIAFDYSYCRRHNAIRSGALLPAASSV